MTTTTQPYHWLKRISPELLKKETIPILGFSPPFPWEKLAESLSQLFQIKNIKLQPSLYERREGKQLLAGFGGTLSPLLLSIAPIDTNIHWIMSTEDISRMMFLLLSPETASSSIVDPETLSGFYHFLALEVINAIPELDFDKSLSINIQEGTSLPKESCLCMDVEITLAERSFWGRIMLPETFQKKWKERYAQRTIESPLSSEIDLQLNLQVGKTVMTWGEWKKVQAGDFLLLDSCSLKSEREGNVILAIDDTAIFVGSIADGHINILQSPLHQEVDIGMSTTPPQDEAFDRPNEEEDIQSSEEDDLDDFEDIEEDEDWASDDTFAAPLPQEKWPPLPEKRPNVEEEESLETAIKEAPPSPPKAPSQTEETKKPISPEEIPLNIIIEVGRLQMSVQHLMELQPGNILDLNIRPEDGVNLTVNGKRIAKGELLLIGDILGVRVIDVG